MTQIQRIPDVITLPVDGEDGQMSWTFPVPPNWLPAQDRYDIPLAFFHGLDDLKMAVNAFRWDQALWIHASISHPTRLPSYEELCHLKADVFGDDGIAAQMFPTKALHVNIHPNCLHLWGPRYAKDWPKQMPLFGQEGTI